MASHESGCEIFKVVHGKEEVEAHKKQGIIIQGNTRGNGMIRPSELPPSPQRHAPRQLAGYDLPPLFSLIIGLL